MSNLENLLLFAAIISLGLSVLFSIWRFIALRIPAREAVGAQTVTVSSRNRLPGYSTITVTAAGLIVITLTIIVRAIETGHGPFSNMYEFSIAFAWGIMAIGFYFWWRYRLFVLITIGSIIALGLLIFANSLPSQVVPLAPALQQSLLLTVHVASAVISYGAFTIGFAAAVAYLIRSISQNAGHKEAVTLDIIGYRTVMIGFLFMTLVIILGALWADIAWGRYWGWDPKETASLVTWLLFAGYLHARIMRGWRGRKSAILLIIGFMAVLFTFFGNYIFAGLHSYG